MTTFEFTITLTDLVDDLDAINVFYGHANDASIESSAGKTLVHFDRDAETPNARIKIKDDGEGIPTDMLQKIFERGFSKRKEESGGLGLHWCANTLIAMGGKITIDSDGAGKGATVQIDLKPAIDQDQEEAA